MSISKICEVGNHPFALEQADIEAYEKFGCEPLSICFFHQHQWRLSFRNDRFLHRRKCDLTGKDIVSMYPQNSPYKVYERDAWFSDRWNPLDYGRPFDFNKTFFEQYADLQKQVPRVALVNVGSTNSEYTNSAVFNKNCYLVFGGDRNEDTMFGALPMYCRDCTDCDWTTRCELCYFCAYLDGCYSCRFAFNSKNCRDCLFIEDCIGCNDCILSFNLRNKSFYIENQPYAKDEYFKKKQEILNGSSATQKELWGKFLTLRQRRIVKYGHIINGENVSGDIIFNSKNCQNVYECIDSEDCRETWTIFTAKDSFNSDYIGQNSTLNFNNLSTDSAYRTSCSYFTVTSSEIDYCEATTSSKNCFGCIGMRHEEFCILNRKYNETEFHALGKKIIEHMRKTGEWGRFFPKSLSTFPYNESTASVFFPREKEQAEREGFRWSEENIAMKPQTYRIPDNIRDADDHIMNEALACETTGRNFKLIPQELAFYRRQNIPIPRRHPDTRYFDRLALRNPFELFSRECQKCKAPITTTYSPGRPEEVYCEKCYLEAVY